MDDYYRYQTPGVRSAVNALKGLVPAAAAVGTSLGYLNDYSPERKRRRMTSPPKIIRKAGNYRNFNFASSAARRLFPASARYLNAFSLMRKKFGGRRRMRYRKKYRKNYRRFRK